MYCKLYGIEGKIPEIKFADPISSLKAYGGYRSIEEYSGRISKIVFKI